MKPEETILILDFGSQYTHLIKSNFNNLGIKSIIEPADIKTTIFKRKFKNYKVKGIVLSGGAFSVIQNKIPFGKDWLSLGVPILGICYGHQLLALIFGGEIRKTPGEYGGEMIVCDTSVPLFSGVDFKSIAWMSHSDTVVKPPKGFSSIASTKDYKNAGIYNKKGNIYGLQFHPEVTHTFQGIKILENFAIKICGMSKSAAWTPKSFLEETVKKYEPIVKDKNVILGLSGGVDSSTLATTLRSFLPKKQLFAIHIDSGLEPKQVKNRVEEFCKQFAIKLIVKDASKRFFGALKGIADPNEKRLIIGRVFIDEFEKIAHVVNAQIFAQGTIWSDVVESGITKYSSTIKSHHNVGGLPQNLKFKLIEPFRELFKDQVRDLASFLKLPDFIVKKQVFPGPGFAIRIDGEVTRKKVEIVRKSTEIINEVMKKRGLKKENTMAFAVYINAASSGIKGDLRFENDYAIVIRVVETKNLLTANFSKKIFPYLDEISTRVIKETRTGKVLYDITNKPPSTIDWQ